jgi:hypothetical protein
VVVQVFNLVMAPGVSGDDWLSEIDVPVSDSGPEADDVITLGRDSVFSRLGSRRTRLIQVAAVGIIGAALLASFLVRTASKHVASSAPPTAVVGLSFRSALVPTMASECGKNACTSNAATDEDLASLREFFGPTYLVRGDRIHDLESIGARTLDRHRRSRRDDAGDPHASSNPSRRVAR